MGHMHCLLLPRNSVACTLESNLCIIKVCYHHWFLCNDRRYSQRKQEALITVLQPWKLMYLVAPSTRALKTIRQKNHFSCVGCLFFLCVCSCVCVWCTCDCDVCMCRKEKENVSFTLQGSSFHICICANLCHGKREHEYQSVGQNVELNLSRSHAVNLLSV